MEIGSIIENIGISIHAPRVGSDRNTTRNVNVTSLFQSTLPVWGATKNLIYINEGTTISIHAPRVGSDKNW